MSILKEKQRDLIYNFIFSAIGNVFRFISFLLAAYVIFIFGSVTISCLAELFKG